LKFQAKTARALEESGPYPHKSLYLAENGGHWDPVFSTKAQPGRLATLTPFLGPLAGMAGKVSHSMNQQQMYGLCGHKGPLATICEGREILLMRAFALKGNAAVLRTYRTRKGVEQKAARYSKSGSASIQDIPAYGRVGACLAAIHIGCLFSGQIPVGEPCWMSGNLQCRLLISK
jgi:hypothetical protein